MNNEHPPTRITFEPQQVLRSNGDTLEADNFTPHSLQDFVNVHEEIIAQQIEDIHLQGARKLKDPSMVKKETILIARLAMRGEEQRALSWGAFQNPQRFYDSPLDLNDKFRPYWIHLAETAFTPRIRNRSSSNASNTTGIWIGVTLP